MAKIYIDLTEFMKIESITGIQRVVREIVFRFIRNPAFETVLISYLEKDDFFRVIDNARFLNFFEEGKGVRATVYSNTYIRTEDIKEGSVFFDIDVAWTATLKRSYLLPKLKAQGVLIAAQIYDIMAITHFQYFTLHFSYTFMEYIGAHLMYADLIIVSTHASLDILRDFAAKVGIEHINGCVAYLGANFQKRDDTKKDVRAEIKAIATRGKFILMVGTIEPRKNHKLLLDAFDFGLKELDYNIIFAGKIGWKNEDFLEKMRAHPCYETRIFHVGEVADSEVDYLYKHAKVVAFPTHMEGFGLPLVEALERGVPVIATDINVLKEIGKDYCYYFEDDSVEAFTACIRDIEKDPVAYKRRHEALKKYRPTTWEESAKIMAGAIVELAESGGSLIC